MSFEKSVNSVIVVAGFSRSHLLNTVGMLNSAGVEVYGVSAIAPKLRFLPSKVVSFLKLDRFTYRRRLMNNSQIKQVQFPELLYQLAVRVPNPSKSHLYRFLANSSFILFSKVAYKYSVKVSRDNKQSLLIRSGFGSAFSKDSRKFVSDASLPHPYVLQSLIRTGEMRLEPIDKGDVISKLILDDTKRADIILVNSDFVKESFLFAGVPENKLVVAYLPPTGVFQEIIHQPRQITKSRNSRLRILFAGTFEERKGLTEILSVAETSQNNSLPYDFIFIGQWGKNTRKLRERLGELENCRVQTWKSQAALLEAMQEADVFLFPSRAEGGARVVTEAMCVGMPIITTRNSGSPIQHLHDGILVKPMDSDGISKWLLRLSSDDLLFDKLASQSRKSIEGLISSNNYLNTVCQICSI